MNTSAAIKAVHYASQITVFCAFMLSQVLARFYKQSQRAGDRKIRVALILQCLAWPTLLSYLAQTVATIAKAIDSNSTAPDLVIDNLTGMFVWLLIATKSHPPWHLHATCALVTGTFDAMLLALNTDDSFRSTLSTIEFFLRASRLSSCVCMIIVAFTSIQKTPDYCGETEPLLTPTSDSSVGKDLGENSKTDDDADFDEWGDSTRWNRELRERISSGSTSWWNYVKAFRIFIPYVVPKKNRKVQASMAIFGCCLIAQRGLNLLIPRQLGIVTDQLAARAAGSLSATPFAALWIYLVLDNVPLRHIQKFAQLPLTMFTYKQVNMAAYDHLMSLSVDFHDNEDPSELQIAIQQGSAIQELLLLLVEQVLPAVVDLIVAFWYFGHIFDFFLSYSVFIATGCYFVFQNKFLAWNRPLRRELATTAREEWKTMFQSISSWRNVYYFNRFDYERSRFDSAVDEYQKADMKYMIQRYLESAVEGFIIGLAFAIAASMVLLLIYQRKAPVGSSVVLLTYWNGLWSPIQSMSGYYRHMNRNLLDAERLLWLFMTKPVVTDSPNAKDVVVTDARVTFKDVDFAYDPRKPTLKGINLDACKGTIALVGETGGGKSTVFKLLQRFHDVNHGSIEIDGQDIRNITLDSLRNAIGVVPQEPFLFNLSIMKNVRYGRLDASDEEVYEVCRAASIHDRILSFPDGYESKVGERGIRLSGGEVQRIAIARCLLKQPSVLLLDEASSAVDSETEAYVQTALSNLTAGRTTFAIAHRLSTIAKANRILVIHGGEIVESGTHEELIRKKGRYHHLWTVQVSNVLNVGENKLGDTANPEQFAE